MSEGEVRLDKLNTLLDTAETQEHIFWGKELLVSYRLSCGLIVTGKSNITRVTSWDIDIEKAREIARWDASSQLQQLEWYGESLGLGRKDEFKAYLKKIKESDLPPM